MIWTVILLTYCIGITIVFLTHTLLLKKIDLGLKEVLSGNLNQRFRAQTLNPVTKELLEHLNQLVIEIQASTQRVDYLEKVRKQMIANVSHDLRTPLTALLGYIEALLEDAHLAEEERERYLKIIADKGNDLLMMINQFFDLTKLEAGDFPLKLEKINIIEIIKETVLAYYQELTRHNLTPILQMPEKPVYITADQSSLKRILANLLSNAVKYGKDGREIGIKVDIVNKDVMLQEINQDQNRLLGESGEFAWIHVWDRGKGIEAKDLPFIFQRLYTGEASRNRKIQGSGLGLTITKRLVEMHNGEIFVSSIPNEKTTFSFYLPAGETKILCQ